jgi:hypothetical protein
VRWHLTRSSGLALCLIVLATIGTASSAGAITTVESQVCEDFIAPAIISPTDGTTTKNTTVMIEGTGEPGKTVAVMKDNTSQAVATVASDGSFGFTVPLVNGGNTFIARETNECGTVKDSSPVTVNADLPPPTDDGGQPVEESPVTSQPDQSPAGRPNTGIIGRPFVPTSNSPGFETPKISASNNNLTVYHDTLLIEGTAYPGSLVTVYVNDQSQAQLFSSNQGTFRLRVVLKEGRNTIKVRSTLGKKSAVSDEVTVTYVKRVSATLTRPLATSQIITTAVVVGAAVAGSATAAIGVNVGIHKFGGRLKVWWRK